MENVIVFLEQFLLKTVANVLKEVIWSKGPALAAEHFATDAKIKVEIVCNLNGLLYSL